MQQTTQPHNPIRLYQQPRPAPKPTAAVATTRRVAPLLSDAEVAERARRIALLNQKMAKLDAAKFELRNEQLRLIQEIASGSELESIEVCNLCGLPHEGECLNG